MASLKMRVNNDKESICSNCGNEWKNVREMYDLRIGFKKERTLPLCLKCIETLEGKFLKASCMYNAKLKTKEDQGRIRREREIDLEESGIKFGKINEAMKGMGVKDDD